MMYDLPVTMEVAGRTYDIRWDWRAALDICAALSDPDLTDAERAFVALDIFYPDRAALPEAALREALAACFRFLSGGRMREDEGRHGPRLVDWEQDFPYIVAPINRALGQEIRALPSLHWWTFLGYYAEIGSDCTFAAIVRIRDKLARGRALDKSERSWYRENRALVDLPTRYSAREDALAEAWR